MPTKTTVRDGIETRRGVRETTYRARIKVAGRPTTGHYRKTRAEAVEDRDRLRHERRLERFADEVPGWTLEQGMREVLDDLAARGATWHTIDDRRKKLRNVAERIDARTPLADIDRHRILAYVTARMAERIKLTRAEEKLVAAGTPPAPRFVSVNTARKDISALSTVFQMAIDRGVATTNPCRSARLPKIRKVEVDWFAAAELAELLKRMRTWEGTNAWHRERDANIVELLALTGMRSTESSRVEIRDVFLARRQIAVRFGKTGSRTVRLNDRAAELANQIIGPRREGRLWPFGNAGLRALFERWRKRLGEPRMHPHAIRHTYGTALAAAGMSAHALARAMGHSTLQMSMVYVHNAGGDSDAIDALVFSAPSGA